VGLSDYAVESGCNVLSFALIDLQTNPERFIDFGAVMKFCALAFASLLLSSCVSQRKFDASAPIGTRSSGLGSKYVQQGEPLDEGDMLDKLAERPATREDAKSAQSLGVFATITAGAGGGLIGWPIGAAIAGSKDPKWILAAIGAALVVVSIPMGVGAASYTKHAVDKHNRSLRENESEGEGESAASDSHERDPATEARPSQIRVEHKSSQPKPAKEPMTEAPETPW
jgi:hypothetical protein